MFSKKRNLIFVFPVEKRVSIHMLFVFFPIHVVFLDKNKKVIYIDKLFPFISMSSPKVKSKYILELINKPSIKLDDKIGW